MKKTLSWLIKAFVSGVLAFSILTLFCVFYYNLPVHSPTLDGATDYSWEINKFYSRGTEGFAWGKTNNEGYINLYDYEAGMDIDVLVMGSSHMEGYNVAMDEHTAAQLDAMYKDGLVYNIGTSGHTFLTCAQNLEKALEKYSPEYVVIETSSVSFSEANINKVIEGKFEELSSHSSGIIGLLQRNQLLRLLYSQLSNWMDKPAESTADNNENNQPETNLENSYLTMLGQLSEIAEAHGTKLIIMYHPKVKIDTKTGLALSTDNEDAQNFAKYCRQSGIEFVDMSERFFAEYNTNHILPHGFTNTSVGQGHLNKYGHKMIAEELYKIIGGKG